MFCLPKYLITIALLVLSLNILASADCDSSFEYKNLRENGAMKGIKTFNQKGIGSCANNTLASALYAQFKTQPSPNQLHANYYSSSENKTNEIKGGARYCESFEKVKKRKRICHYDANYLNQVNQVAGNKALVGLAYIFSSFKGEDYSTKFSRREMLEAIDQFIILKKEKNKQCPEFIENHANSFFSSKLVKSNDFQHGLYGKMTNLIKSINSFTRIDFEKDSFTQEEQNIFDNMAIKFNIKDPDKTGKLRELNKSLSEEFKKICKGCDLIESNNDLIDQKDHFDMCVMKPEGQYVCASLDSKIKLGLFRSYQKTNQGESKKDIVDSILMPLQKSAPKFSKLVRNEIFFNKKGSKGQRVLKDDNDLNQDLYDHDLKIMVDKGIVDTDEHLCRGLMSKIIREKLQESNLEGTCDQEWDLFLSLYKMVRNVSDDINKEEFIDRILAELKRKRPGGFIRLYDQVFVDQKKCDQSHISQSELKSVKCDSQRHRAGKNKSVEEIATDLISKFDKKLKEDKPIMISYCTGFFKIPGFSIRNNPRNCDPEGKLPHGHHASIIIGQRCVDGDRQYLVQNSWGNQCDSYQNEEIKCNPNEGNLWVSEKVLLPNIYHSATLEKN